MPTPAGTGLSRRGFLLASAGLALSVYGAGRLLDPSSVRGRHRAARPKPTDAPVLVSVYLQGGIDSMSVLYPAGDPLYSAVPRRRSRCPPSAGPVFTEDPRSDWHPLAAPLAQLHGEGKVSVMPAVGYSDPNQSHFTSRHFWEVGATQADLLTGWMGRYLDLVGTADNPLQGLCLDDSLQPALATARMPVATIDPPSSYSFYASGVWGPPQTIMYDGFDALGRVGVRLRRPRHGPVRPGGADVEHAAPPAAALPAAIRRSHARAARRLPGSSASERRVPRAHGGDRPAAGAGLPLRCVSVSTESVFDTHENQTAALDTGLDEAAQTLYAFQRDLEARGLADRVLTLVWSEFGRRPQENASGGTDHGAAGCAFVMGTRAAGTMIGEWPGLATGLDALGNLRATADFRGLYCSLLEQWLGHEAAPIIPGAASLGRVPVVA